MRIWQDWDGVTFVIDKVDTNYATANKYSPPSPDCYNNGCGGASVTYTQTITLRAIGSVGSKQVVTPYILDDSGGSFHYNNGAGHTATITITTPTAVKLRSFDATRSGEDTLLSWKTGREVNNLGFRIYRDSPNGDRVVVTPELVAGNVLFSGPHTELSSGNSYHFLDRGAPAGATYYLEDIDISGVSTLSSPATARQIEGPALLGSRAPSTMSTEGNSPSISDVAPRSGMGAQTPEGFSLHPSSTDDDQPELLVAKKGSASAQSQQFGIASEAGAKLSVREEGWYRVTRQDLKNAGWDPGANPDRLQLYVEGTPIPMLVTNLGGGNYSMEFYGTGLDTVFTDTRVYWIVLNPTPGSRLANKNSTGGSSSTGADFPFTVGRKDRVIYVPGILNGDAESWYGPLVGPSWFTPADQSVNVSHLNSSNGGSATLDLAIEAATADVLHSIDVSVNGNPAGTVTFKGQGHFQSSLSIPVSWLVEGSNSILLQEEGGSNFSVMDSVALTYPHLFNADSDALGLTVSGSKRITVSGFTIPGIRVFDVTNPSAVTVLSRSVGPDGSGGYAATFSTPAVTGQLHLLAVADDRVSAPADLESNAPSSLNKKGSADFVMISHPSFASTLTPLQSLRQSQGLATQIVDVTDIYDEFNYGEKDPAAIKAFLQWTKSNWKKAPKYVLLVGDGSYDPRDYFGIGTSDFIPAKLVSTVFLKTASDDWYVDFNNDGLPDMAIGRLPAESPSDASTMISKIVGYDSAPPSASVLLVADHEDENDFHGAISALKTLVAGKTAQTICIDPDPIDPSYPNIGPCVSASTAHGQILDAFNSGQSVVNWVGHGEPTSWSQSDVFDTSDVPSLANSAHLPLALTMDCLNGYFHDPNTESFAESLLRAPNGGAVAVWASSSLTLFESQVPVNQTLFQLLFTTPAPRLGDAVKTAKGVTTDSDVRKTWIFFGDPTMKLK